MLAPGKNTPPPQIFSNILNNIFNKNIKFVIIYFKSISEPKKYEKWKMKNLENIISKTYYFLPTLKNLLLAAN